MKKLFAVAGLLLAGCSLSNTGSDGGVEAGSGPSPDVLCTSTDPCRTAPCTPGCTFVLPAAGTGCPDAAPLGVDGKTVTACSGFCGLFTDPRALGCGLYNGSHPGCETCGMAWGAASCVDLTPMIDYTSGGSVCVYPDTCFNGMPPPDQGVPCDLGGMPD
jgi:hypothetical protein